MKCRFCPASYSTAVEVHMHVERSDCRQRFYERQRAIRAIVGTQWAVAIAVCADEYEAIATLAAMGDESGLDALRTLNRVAMLPCAVDVVGEAS